MANNRLGLRDLPIGLVVDIEFYSATGSNRIFKGMRQVKILAGGVLLAEQDIDIYYGTYTEIYGKAFAYHSNSEPNLAFVESKSRLKADFIRRGAIKTKSARHFFKHPEGYYIIVPKDIKNPITITLTKI